MPALGWGAIRANPTCSRSLTAPPAAPRLLMVEEPLGRGSWGWGSPCLVSSVNRECHSTVYEDLHYVNLCNSTIIKLCGCISWLIVAVDGLLYCYCGCISSWGIVAPSGSLPLSFHRSCLVLIWFTSKLQPIRPSKCRTATLLNDWRC